MNKVLSYKGFSGSVDFDEEDEILHGKILFIADTICYDATSVPEVKQAFYDAVDAYIEFCAEIGKSPNKPCSGTFNVRISPELHQEACLYALKKGISLNALVKQSIEDHICTQHTHQLASSVNDLGQHIGQMAHSFRQVMRSSMQPIETQATWSTQVPVRH